MLRSSLSRACGSCSLVRPVTQSSRFIQPASVSFLELQRQKRFASTPHAISNPTLAGIEKRWEAMPPQEQATLWMQLRDRMEQDWHHLTMQEKKAGMFNVFNRCSSPFLTAQQAYWIAFGNHGPRALPPPGENLRIFVWTAGLVGLSFVIFYIIRAFAREPPRTMNKEWQEATNEYLKVGFAYIGLFNLESLTRFQSQNSEPITGISSEGYEGKGYVQSK